MFLHLSENKFGKSDVRDATALFLQQRLGDVNAFNTTGPLCNGDFNSKLGINVE